MRRVVLAFMLAGLVSASLAAAQQAPRGGGGAQPGRGGAPPGRGGAQPGRGGAPGGGGGQREIVQVAENVYRARNANYYAFVIVTPDGIILTDPINPAFAQWMKEQFAERFRVPVRYVIYSHSHWDHVEGGKVFADTAHFIAQENMARNMDGRIPQMPGDILDRNNNGTFEQDEIVGPMVNNQNRCGMPAFFFTTSDRNSDGHMTPKEMQQDIHPPDILYSDRMTLTLGGKTVQLIHPGKNHSDDSTVLYLPKERIVFATEFLADVAIPATGNILSFPSACGAFDGNPLSEWLRSYRTVEALDFDTFIGGHAAVATKADVVENRKFFEDLIAAVSAGMAQGKSLEELKQTIMLDKYKSWQGYAARRGPTIESAFNNLRLYR